MQKKKDKKKQLLKLSLLLFSFSAFRLYFAGYIHIAVNRFVLNIIRL